MIEFKKKKGLDIVVGHYPRFTPVKIVEHIAKNYIEKEVFKKVILEFLAQDGQHATTEQLQHGEPIQYDIFSTNKKFSGMAKRLVNKYLALMIDILEDISLLSDLFKVYIQDV